MSPTTPHLIPRRRPPATRPIAITLLVLAVAIAGTASAWASASEERQGAALLAQLQSGRTSCAKLSPSRFELIGEYVMGRMLGSPALHEEMNRHMTAVMGAGGESQAHTYMGRRFAGCAGGRPPGAFGAMWGMMGAGMMGGGYGSGASGSSDGAHLPYTMGPGRGPGMMGGGYGPYMMGYPYGSHHDGDLGAGAIVAIVLGSLVVLALAVALVIRFRPRSAQPGAG